MTKPECPGLGGKGKFQGNVLPLFGEDEMEWPPIIRLILYLMGLAWLFLAVGMISDIFMQGIERVTSWRKRIKKLVPGSNPPEYKKVTVYIWNATIANLTLMALGSSAPEILLSVIEIVTGDFLLGDLGAGTIVGSAAFNLLVISAVCVAAIPDKQVRKINQFPVYIITAFFSVFAYIWLMLMVMAISPNVVTSAEAIVTLLFLPLLLTLAFLADKGHITFGITIDEEKKDERTIDANVTKEELAEVHKSIKERHGPDLTVEQITNIMKIEYLDRKSKAYYRNVKKKNIKQHEQNLVEEMKDTCDDATNERSMRAVYLGFENPHYAFLESCVKLQIKIIREGNKEAKVSVKYATREDTATAITDFIPVDGTMVFERGETEKIVEIELVDDNAYEEDEDFYVDLTEPLILDDTGNSAMVEAKLAELTKTARITIIDDDLPGKLRFEKDEMEATEDAQGDTTFEVIVERYDGGNGDVGCKYRTEGMNAIAGVDYVETSGSISFADKVMVQKIPITIKHSGRYAKQSSFTVTLFEPTGGVKFNKESDGGDEAEIGHVIIKGYPSETREVLLTKMKSKVIASTTANQAYVQQFIDAFTKVKDDDDEDENKGEAEDGGDLTDVDDKPSLMDWFFHIIGVPWKFLFAFVPPTQYLGGWATFFGALCMIAVITALIGDMANLVGCTMGLDPEVTAITFVALGTSLPDTFASKTAAEMDPYADNSIGNVTGSNSVNVFIGLGLSWSLAALYWEANGRNDAWDAKFLSFEKSVQDDIQKAIGTGSTADAVFMVPAGSLWFNLMVFSINAFFAIQHLFARRKRWGGELGGPKKGFMGQYFSAAFLAAQWFLYVIASTIFVYAIK